MKRKIKIFQNSIIATFIYVFIILYFLLLISLYIIPNNLKISIFLLLGFTIIIIGVFYFFVSLNHGIESDKIVLNFKLLNENSIKIIFTLLMIVAFFIPPITFTESIIDWNQIEFLNYVRAIIFVIGCTFLPGACIFNILFPKCMIHKRFNVEPFLLKITIYPLLSFTFLGISTLILDKIGLNREYFTYILFFMILILFICDFVIHNHRDNHNLKLKSTEIKISKYSFLILFIALGIIILALGIHIDSKYLIPGDRWRGISYAYSIGRSYGSIDDKFCGGYTVYWGCISFGLSTLSGIPYININAMLFPFVYLFITSIFLFMKALLHDFKEIYATLSTILVVIFSGLFYIFNPNLELNVSPFTRLAMVQFSYHSFAFFSLFTSMALFIIISKTSKGLEIKSIFKSEEFIIIILAVLFLLQCFLTYFLPIIAGISLIIIYCLFSNKKRQDFKLFLIFWLFFIIIVIFIDIISTFFFSWTCRVFISSFLGESPPILEEIIFLNALLIYLILIGSCIFFFFLYMIYNRFMSGNNKQHLKLNFIPKILFILFLIIFSVLLVIEIFTIFLEDIKPRFFPNSNFLVHIEENFFTFYLDLIFLNIGFIGILGIYLSYFCFKKNRPLFNLLLTWGGVLFNLASILIFIRWLNYPFTPPLEIPGDEYYYMIYWFDRIWYYSIIPLSIFSSIGIIRIREYLKSKRFIINANKYLSIVLDLTSSSTIIFLSLSLVITDSINWYNWYDIKDEEAQIIGWVSENVPHDSFVLIDSYRFKPLDDIIFCRYYAANIYSVFVEALGNDKFGLCYYGVAYKDWDITHKYDSNCSVEFIEELDGHENVSKFNDQYDNGSASILIKFDSAQENGSIEFFIRTTDKTNNFEIKCLSNEQTTGIYFSINSSAFYCYNNSIYQKIMDIQNDMWYQCKINFQCKDNNYTSLNQYRWKVIINKTEYGEFIFANNLSQIRYLELSSSKSDYGWSTFLDGLIFSWTTNFNIETLIFNTPIIIDFLKSKNITYFILTRNYDKRFNFEELTLSFYKKKLYEYKNIEIYYANES